MVIGVPRLVRLERGHRADMDSSRPPEGCHITAGRDGRHMIPRRLVSLGLLQVAFSGSGQVTSPSAPSEVPKVPKVILYVTPCQCSSCGEMVQNYP